MQVSATRHLYGVYVVRKLLASLSGTFLQTLPDLVTPLKGHALFIALFISAQLSTDAVSNLAPKHAREYEKHPPQVKKEFRLDSNNFGFI